MKKTTLKTVSAFLLFLFVLSGCTDGFDSLKPQGYMALRLVAVDLEGAPTKAVTPNEDAITLLWVLQFDGTGDGATFVGKNVYSSPNTNNLKLGGLTPGTNQTLVFAGNLNIDEVKNFDSGTLATFKALSLPVASEESLFPMSGYIPMLGTWTGTIISNAEGDSPITATIQMQRTVVKLSFTLKSGLRAGDSFKATSIRLHRVPATMCLAETTDALYPAAGFTPVTGTYGSVAGGDLPQTVTWYMPENRRGTGTATVTKDKDETTAHSGQGPSTTYIEVIGDYVTGGATRVVRYRVWPGGNSTNDYNLKRNSSYALTTTLKDMTTSSNRVEVYGQAYTGITEPDEKENDINGMPFLENLHSVKQSAKTEAVATTQLIVDGENATSRGFVYSTTANTEAMLQLSKSGVLATQESGSFSSGIYSKALTGLGLATTYYIRAFATNTNGTGYSDIFTYTTPRVEPAANCLMVVPGETVMFEPKDALGAAKTITGAQLLWQTRDDGTAAGNPAISEAADVVYDATNKLLIVRTNPACAAANAVIQGTGGTPWTWHVWVTPYRPQEAVGNAALQYGNANVAVPLGRVQTYDTKYQAAVGTGKGIMGRNLGSQATSILLDPAQVVSDPAFHFGMLYQWGSRMPWTPTTKTSTTAAAPVFGFDATPLEQQAVLGSYFEGSPSGSWSTEKTATDPCPAGWRVPRAGAFDDFANYGVFPGYNGTGNAAGRMYIQGAVNAWYFCSGARTGAGDSFVEVNANGYTWTATADGTNAKALTFDDVDGITGVVTPQASVPKVRALPVRCVQH